MGKSGFVLYDEQYDGISLLSLEDKGALLTAIFEYRINGAVSIKLSGSASMAFQFVRGQMDRDGDKYERICERRREYGSLGGKQKVANATISKQKVASVADTDTDTDTDTDVILTNNNIKRKKETTSLKKESDPFEERFARFWDVYPRKVGKGIAKKAFLKLKPSDKLTDKMIEAVKVQARSEQWTRERGQYIPHPATWINQERWEDSTEIEYPTESEGTTEEILLF